MSKCSPKLSCSKDRYHWIDCIRFIAAAIVVVGHVRGFHWVPYAELDGSSRSTLVWIFFAVSRLGHEAVIVFFVLSGFLVGGPLVERCWNQQFAVRQFWVDRVTRIYIPLVPAWGTACIAAIITQSNTSFVEWVGNFFALQGVCCRPFAGNSPLWSLSYEIWFYVLAGTAGGAACGPSRWRGANIALLTLSLAVFMILDARYLLIWISGAIFFLLRKVLHGSQFLSTGIAISLIATAISQLSSATNSTIPRIGLTIPIFSVWFSLATGVGIALPSLMHSRPKQALFALIDSIGSKLAACSYTLYLVHFPILSIINHYFPGRYASIDSQSLMSFAVKIFLISIFTIILYMCFERRTSTVRRMLTPSFS